MINDKLNVSKADPRLDIVNKGSEACEPNTPCDACEGDCDNDAGCKGTLKCFSRSNYQPATVRGCKAFSKPDQDTDYCYDPAYVEPEVFVPNPGELAFDGNYISKYVSRGRPGTCFVGINVGEGKQAVLSRVRYFPVASLKVEGQKYASPGGFAMKGGTIEGSNSLEGTWTTLATITDPHQGWNWLDIKSKRAFQYLRYSGSDTSFCHVSEMEWIGVVVQSSGTCKPTVSTHNNLPHPSLGAEVVTQPHTFESNGPTFVYTKAQTPVVQSVEPRFGSSLGGTTVTIKGSRFPTVASNAEVEVNGLPCTITAVIETEIKCVTSKRSGFVAPSVSVRHVTPTSNGMGGSGSSVLGTSIRLFRFLDRWSEVNTWLNDEPPGDGDSVVIPADQTLLMDVDPPRLQVVLVLGLFVFDRRDLHLDAEYIVIQGGKMEVGSEEEPFLGGGM